MPAAKFLMTRTCEICGSSFTPKTITSKYCCKKCSDVAYKRKKDKQKRLDAMNAVVDKIPESRDYISISEAMALFGIGKNSIYRLIRTGQLPSINIGERLTRINKADLMKITPIREQTVEIKSETVLYDLDPKNCYSIGEIAKKFHINEGTVYSHIRKYSIPTRQIGNFVYAPKSEIDKLYK